MDTAMSGLAGAIRSNHPSFPTVQKVPTHHSISPLSAYKNGNETSSGNSMLAGESSVVMTHGEMKRLLSYVRPFFPRDNPPHFTVQSGSIVDIMA